MDPKLIPKHNYTLNWPTIKSNWPIKNIIMHFDLIFYADSSIINYFILKSIFFIYFWEQKRYDRALKSVQNLHLDFTIDIDPFYFIFVLFWIELGA